MFKRLQLFLLSTLFLASIISLSTQAQPTVSKTDFNRLYEIAATQGYVPVIIGLTMPTNFPLLNESEQMQQITNAQDSLVASLSTVSNVKYFPYIPFMALTVDAAGLQTLNASALVNYIQEDGKQYLPRKAESLVVAPQELAQNNALIGADKAWAMGYDGKDFTLAVLDTGIDKTHEALVDKVVSEACYSTTSNKTTSACPDQAAESVADGSGAPCTQDGCSRGTHVAGIIAGNVGEFNGVAKGATLISIQVFSMINDGDCSTNYCVTAFDSDVIKGLNRVYKLRNNHAIAAVHVGIWGNPGPGSNQYGTYYEQSVCDADNAAALQIINKLNSANIAVISGSGDDLHLGAMRAPACLTGVVSVGAVFPNGALDLLHNFTNVAPFLDLLSPGIDIQSSIPGDQYTTMGGTEFAGAHVVGTWAIMRDFKEDLQVQQIEKSLKETGVETGHALIPLTFRRIRIDQAIHYLIVPTDPVLISPLQDEITHAPPVTFTWEPSLDVTDYQLKIKNKQGEAVLKHAIDLGQCTESLCSYTLNDPIVLNENGTYTWMIAARHGYINWQNKTKYNKAKSNKLTIIVDYPGAAALQHPTDDMILSDRTEWTTLEWLPVVNATAYKLIVKDEKNGDKILRMPFLQTECAAEVCSYAVTDADRALLKDDHNYEWFVKAVSEYGKSKSEKFRFKARFGDTSVLRSTGQ